jgi:hypothetical protein
MVAVLRAIIAQEDKVDVCKVARLCVLRPVSGLCPFSTLWWHPEYDVGTESRSLLAAIGPLLTHQQLRPLELGPVVEVDGCSGVRHLFYNTALVLQRRRNMQEVVVVAVEPLITEEPLGLRK